VLGGENFMLAESSADRPYVHVYSTEAVYGAVSNSRSNTVTKQRDLSRGLYR